MEANERDRSATDVEQDLGEPGASVEAADTATADLGSGAVGVGRPRSAEGEAADVEQGNVYSGETAATDPTLR